MVTIKRKINTETDRYGGFSEIELKTPSQNEELNNSFREAQYKEAESRINYSAPPSVTNEINRDIVSPEIESKQVQANESASEEEFMPRIYTHETSNIQKVKKNEKIDSRTKLILGIYISIIVLLSALVIGTGIAISSTDSQVKTLENEMTVKNARLVEQLDQISRLSDENSITGRAYNNGMENVESYEEIELLPMGDAQTYKGISNWFDSFCDWLSGVFGG